MSSPRGLPPYRYGIDPGPHPTRHPKGHGRGRPEPADDAEAFEQGRMLFENGYYWEAHEAWEGPWRRRAADDPCRDAWQALILVAAAALKRVRGEHGAAARLASKAVARIAAAEASGCRSVFDMDVTVVRRVARRLVEDDSVPSGLRLR